LTDPRPDAIFCMHVMSPFPLGTIAMAPGPVCASSYYFKVTIRGKDTHGCNPHLGVNPIDVSAHVIQAINSMQAMEFNVVTEPTLITIGMIHAGSYMINLPEELEFQGSIRCLHDNMEAVHRRFREVVEATCKAHRCTCDVEITCGNNMLVNDPELYEIGKSVAAGLVGAENITDEGVREMGGDDLAEFFREGIPGLYYLVGMRNPEKGCVAPHHNKDFRVDEDVLDIGVQAQTGMVLKYLGAIE